MKSIIASVSLLLMTAPALGADEFRYERFGVPIPSTKNDFLPVASASDHDCWCVGGSAPNNACMTPQDCRDTGGRCTMDDRCKKEKK